MFNVAYELFTITTTATSTTATSTSTSTSTSTIGSISILIIVVVSVLHGKGSTIWIHSSYDSETQFLQLTFLLKNLPIFCVIKNAHIN